MTVKVTFTVNVEGATPASPESSVFFRVVVSDSVNTACVIDEFGYNYSPNFDADVFSEDEVVDVVGFKFAHKEEAQEVANAVNFNEPQDFNKSA